jgi:hypothetical protein
MKYSKRSLMMCALWAHTIFAWADGPKPLPRPDLLPLDASSIQRIQVIGKAVVDSRANSQQDPKALALRQALLDVKQTLDEHGAQLATVQSSRGCPESNSGCSKNASIAQSAFAVSGSSLLERRQALHDAIEAANGQPKLAHMIAKAQEIDSKVSALDTLQGDERVRSLNELRRQLTPSATPQDQPRTIPQVVVTFHTNTSHRDVKKANVPTFNRAGKKL